MIAFKEQLKNWGWFRSWRPYFLIFAIGFLLYSQTLFFNFTYFDDNELIVNKAAFLENTKNIGAIFSTDAFLSADKFYYRPLLNLSFMADAQLGGDLPFFYHLDNILLHILAAMLVFCFLKKISRRPSLSFFFSLVFLVHPVLTQAVAWIPGRNDSLLAVFVLAAFIFFLNFLHNPKPRYYLGYLLFLLFSLLVKETAVLLPILVIFYFWFIDKGEINKTDKLLLIFGSGAAGFIWFLMRTFALGGEPLNYFSAILQIIKNSSAILLDIGKIILPINLSVLPILQDSNLIYGLIISILLIAVWLISKKKRINYSLFGLAWFLMFLLPSFIRINTLPDFLEHRLHVPLIGFFIILMEIDWIKNLDFTKKKVKIGTAVILIIFSLLTWQHSKKFSDRLIFWQTAVNDSPHSPLAERNLGAMYYLDDKLDRAVQYYQRALEINPNEAMIHNNLGLIYAEKKNYQLAEEEYKKELSLYPNHDKALFNLGLLYYNLGRKEDAGALWQQALMVNPQYSEAYYHLLNLQNQLR